MGWKAQASLAGIVIAVASIGATAYHWQAQRTSHRGAETNHRNPVVDARSAPAVGLLLPTAPLIRSQQNEPRSEIFTAQAAIDRPSLLLLEQVLSAGHDTDRADAFTTVLPALIAEDAQAVARFAEVYTGAEREQLIRRTAQLWAATDASSALAWAETLPSVAELDATVTDICAEVANTSPARAVELRARYSSTTEPDPALENFLQQWATQDFAGSLDWVLARPEGQQRDLLLERLAFVEARSAPADAARLVFEHMPEGPAQTSAVITVLQQWALRDLPGAADWVSRLPTGALRARATEELRAIAPALH